MAGACIVRRAAYLQAGGYEPRFFIGGEEALLTLDLATLGWDMLYAGHIRTWHYLAPARPGRAAHLLSRNALWTAWLRLPLRAAWEETRSVLRLCARARPGHPGPGGRAGRCALGHPPSRLHPARGRTATPAGGGRARDPHTATSPPKDPQALPARPREGKLVRKAGQGRKDILWPLRGVFIQTRLQQPAQDLKRVFPGKNQAGALLRDRRIRGDFGVRASQRVQCAAQILPYVRDFPARRRQGRQEPAPRRP